MLRAYALRAYAIMLRAYALRVITLMLRAFALRVYTLNVEGLCPDWYHMHVDVVLLHCQVEVVVVAFVKYWCRCGCIVVVVKLSMI